MRPNCSGRVPRVDQRPERPGLARMHGGGREALEHAVDVRPPRPESRVHRRRGQEPDQGMFRGGRGDDARRRGESVLE